MEVLVTDAESPTADVAALALARAGHVVHRCHDERDPLHCVAERGARCPLDIAPIDVAVAVGAAGDGGGRCAVRRRLAIAVIDNGTDGADAVAAVDAAERQPLWAHSRAATAAFRRSLGTAGLPTDGRADVHRRAGYLKVTLDAPFHVPEDVVQRAAVRVCQALRELDGDARGIDVASPKAVAR